MQTVLKSSLKRISQFYSKSMFYFCYISLYIFKSDILLCYKIIQLYCRLLWIYSQKHLMKLNKNNRKIYLETPSPWTFKEDRKFQILGEKQFLKIRKYQIIALIYLLKLVYVLFIWETVKKIIVIHVVNMRVVSIIYEELLNQVKREERKQPLNMGKIFF